MTLFRAEGPKIFYGVPKVGVSRLFVHRHYSTVFDCRGPIIRYYSTTPQKSIIRPTLLSVPRWSGTLKNSKLALDPPLDPILAHFECKEAEFGVKKNAFFLKNVFHTK